jgi:dihydrofolate synthase/folylpolyglutamate synthase
MNYKQAIAYLSDYTDYEKLPMPHDPAFYDLRRVEELMAQLGHPQLRARSMHITGTNGKGSVAAMVASVLSVSGYTTGLYTSPHLYTWRERIRVNGELISEEELASLVEWARPDVEAVNRRATYGQLTTFELLTALAFAYFSQKGADFQVLEVGMGGKFDATSVITPEVCIITNISLDHTEVLGKTMTKIAAEKAAIIKPGSTVIISPQFDEVEKVIEETCRAQGARLVRVGRDVSRHSLGFDLYKQLLRVEGRWSSYALSVPLLGEHQLDNAATAVAALEVLVERGFNISRQAIIEGMARVNWPGRFQVLGQHPLLVVDGAHNPDAARRLRESLGRYFSFDRAILVIGTSGDKDIAGIASELSSFFDKIIATRSHHPRAAVPESIAAEFRRLGAEVQVEGSVSEALSVAQSMAGTEDLICVAGSLFVIAEAIERATHAGLHIEW